MVTYTYDEWGKILSVTGTLANTVGQMNPIRYRGYYYDVETGLYYLQSRYYDPETGRFINADGYASTGQGVLGTNMYAYCINNPILLADASGTRPDVSGDLRRETKEQRRMSFACINRNIRCEGITRVRKDKMPDEGGVTVYKGRPRICTDGSDGSKVPDSDRGNYTAYAKWNGNSGKVLDAYKMPYVVIPKGNKSAKLGEVAYLVNHDNGSIIKCIIGDVGPANNGWGEVSIAAIWESGYENHMTANSASGITDNYEIIIFPGQSYGYNWSWGYSEVRK